MFVYNISPSTFIMIIKAIRAKLFNNHSIISKMHNVNIQVFTSAGTPAKFYALLIKGALSLVVNGACENQQLPIRYKYIYSRKGHKQLVHMNFVYTKHSTTHGKTSWRCVQYFSLNRCPATVETIDAMIYAVNHQHNHEDCYEKLVRNNIYEMSVSPK